MDTNRRERFKRLFLAHYSRLCGVAYGFVADGEDAEDIVQELFINVWDKGKDSLSDKEFAAYMTVAVRNSCISFLRKKLNYLDPEVTISSVRGVGYKLVTKGING